MTPTVAGGGVRGCVATPKLRLEPQSHAVESAASRFPLDENGGPPEEPLIGIASRHDPCTSWNLVMARSLKQLRHRRTIVGVLAVAWLPYMSIRCIESSGHLGCPIASESHDSVPPSDDVHRHAHDSHQESPHSHQHVPVTRTQAPSHDPPPRTCCELTGKYAVTLAAPAPSAAPLVMVASFRRAGDVPQAPLPARAVRQFPEPSHHPPPYLLFATLLI